MRSQRGFTLLELMICIFLVGILAGLGISSLRTYRARGANSVAQRTLQDARTILEASLNEVDTAHAMVNWFTQNGKTSPGKFTNGAARSLFPTFDVPRNVAVTVYHDPDCMDASCTSDSLETKHCFGDNYTSYTRFGDGVDVRLEIAGVGC